jgi:hypothetical protein
MTFGEWVAGSVQAVRSDGLDGIKHAGFQLYKGAFRRLDMLDSGTNVYEREWDLLVILDACRLDLMAEVIDDVSYLGSLGKLRSVGSSSSEWLERTFTDRYRDEIRRTVHVTGNPNTRASLPTREFAHLDEVWEYEWDDELGTIHPDPLTDRAIALHREHDPDRMIVHYMQPHHPFVENPLGEGFGGTDPWDMIRLGEVSREEVWRRYRRNLEYVLEALPLLLNNIDADRVAVTADHGNLLGEYGLYAHPAKIAVSQLRDVPWCTTTASDTGRYEPTIEPTRGADDVVEDRLADLGYR